MKRKATAIGLLACGLLLGGCGGTSDHTSRAQPTTVAVPSSAEQGLAPAPARPDWCATRGQSLDCVSSGSVLSGVVYRGDPADSSLVLWDPGGPGLGLPDESTQLRDLIPRAIRNRNVLLVVEPWVRHPPKDACLRGAFEAKPPRSCALATLATRTRQIVATARAAERQSDLRMDGAYLQDRKSVV